LRDRKMVWAVAEDAAAATMRGVESFMFALVFDA
jgi:hypothetical protein